MNKHDKGSLDQCREIMNKDGVKYSDEELVVIMSFMQQVVEMTGSHYERVHDDSMKVIHINKNNSDHETKSIPICTGKYRRAS